MRLLPVLLALLASLCAASAQVHSSLYFALNVDPIVGGLAESTHLNLSATCRRHVAHLVSEAIAHRPWALNLIDSIGKPSVGMSQGNVNYLGQFSQCLDSVAEVHSPLVEAADFRFGGQYCLATVTLAGEEIAKIGAVSGLSESYWRSVRPRIGVCGPSSCSLDEMRKVVSAVINGFLPNSTATVSSCSARNDNLQSDTGAHLFLGFMVVFACLILMGTLYEYRLHYCDGASAAKKAGFKIWNSSGCPVVSSTTSLTSSGSSVADSESPLRLSGRQQSSVLYRIAAAFSLRANAKQILSTAEDNSIGAFHGLRVISMFWIIYGHSYSFGFQWLFFEGNPEKAKMTPDSILSQMVANGTFAVDTFFYLSGFLVAMSLMKELTAKKGRLNLVKVYVHRYIRMAPLMMIIIGFSTTLLKYTGAGPAWQNSTLMYDDWCRKNWWVNLLFLQNFINRENMCLSHSWYSAVDFQLYLIAPLIVIPLYKSLKWGSTVLAAFLLTSIVTTVALTLHFGFPAVPYFNSLVTEETLNLYYGQIYIKPYARMGPFLVGIAVGYLYTVFKKNEHVTKSSGMNLVLRPVTSLVGWLISLTVLVTILAAMVPVFRGVAPPPLFEAFYSALSRPLWAASLGWMTWACVSGHGGVVNELLSWSGWRPLSRLTYAVYLVHPVVMAAFYGAQETTFQFSQNLMMYFALGNTVTSYLVSLILSLCFELPFSGLEKAFLPTH